jgi:hypothetical protein
MHRLIRQMKHLAKINVPLYLRNKRANKQAKHEHRIWKDQSRAKQYKASVNDAFGSDSKVVVMLAAGTSAQNDRKISKGHVKFIAPSSFSMMENPEGTLIALRDLASMLLLPKVRRVKIDMSAVKSYDLGANALLDILVEEVNTKARHTKRRIRWSGSYPAEPVQRRLVQSLGVIKFLEVSHEYTPPKEAARIDSFHDRSKHYVRAVRPNDTDKKSRTTQKFADHINKCLSRIQRALTPVARKKLCDYVGEILDNAEEHARMYDWTVQGYLDTNSAGESICELVILNFGHTVAQSLLSLPTDSYTRQCVQPYLDAHARKGIFSSGWAIDDLMTLIALQGSVSSKNSSADDTRGNGTVDVISFFEKMASECLTPASGKSAARMLLVSGSTSILFDGTHKMSVQGDRPGIIAFNLQNDLENRPDPTYVRHLSEVTFPGTILSIKFPLSFHSTSMTEDERK